MPSWAGWWPGKVSVKALVAALSYIRLAFLIDSNIYFKLVKFVIVTHQ